MIKYDNNDKIMIKSNMINYDNLHQSNVKLMIRMKL